MANSANFQPKRFKYPRTYHLPWSLGATSDDKITSDLSSFKGKRVIVTEKMDGENTTIYFDGHIHARSLDSVNHPSRNWIKNFSSNFFFLIPPNHRLVGENLYASHSIRYHYLPSFFLGISIWHLDLCLNWSKTVDRFDRLGVFSPKVLYDGIFDVDHLKSLYSPTSPDNDECEGYVVRLYEEFTISNFSQSVVKFVRKGHVEDGDDHWMHRQLVRNFLKTP